MDELQEKLHDASAKLQMQQDQRILFEDFQDEHESKLIRQKQKVQRIKRKIDREVLR